jgi:hypothetical protein
MCQAKCPVKRPVTSKDLLRVYLSLNCTMYFKLFKIRQRMLFSLPFQLVYGVFNTFTLIHVFWVDLT